MTAYIRPWAAMVRGWLRGGSNLVLEKAALRHQQAMYDRRRLEVRDSDRLFSLLLVRIWPGWRGAVIAVRPETVAGRLGTLPAMEEPDQPRRTTKDRSRGAREPAVGCGAYPGRAASCELRALGHEVSAETVRRYRLRARRRPPSPSWRAFLRNHRREIWAADFFTVPTLSLSTLYVFFLSSLGRRRIEHNNVTKHPTAQWVWRRVIEATPRGTNPRFLIRDRERSYGGDFIARARRIGIRTALTPVRAPKANAIDERVVGTLRRECVDHIIR